MQLSWVLFPYTTRGEMPVNRLLFVRDDDA
jgi:hypothetical protein